MLDRFCGVHYTDIANNIDILSYCAYLPTAGQDGDFTEVLSFLTLDISTHRRRNLQSLLDWTRTGVENFQKKGLQLC